MTDVKFETAKASNLSRLVELLAVNPARILRVPGGALSEGTAADITILAPDLKVRVNERSFRSRSSVRPRAAFQPSTRPTWSSLPAATARSRSWS